MVLANNTVDGRGLSNKAGRELLHKKTKAIIFHAIPVHFTVIGVLPVVQYYKD